jgi:hypothetical protein
MNNDSMALMSILRSNPDLAERIERITEAVKEDKKNLLEAANDYNSRYQEEIEEGTRKRQLLLTEGKKRGMTEDEVLSTYGQFLPSVQTPILNFLFFVMREENEVDKLKRLTEQFIKEYGYGELVRRLNKQFDPTKEVNLRDVISSDNVREPKEMTEYLYNGITHELFVKIKKLKRLAKKSSNNNESFLAWQMANKLCEKYNINFDLIPDK